jgi:ATP-dependent DNA helicase 2 subunit 2
MLHDQLSPKTDSTEVLPTMITFDSGLADARHPRPTVVSSTLSAINLHIGSPTIDSNQAIIIPIKFSKATMKARPPSLSKAWKAALDLQAPTNKNDTLPSSASSVLAASLAEQSRNRDQLLNQSDLAAMISADVQAHYGYTLKRLEHENSKDQSEAPNEEEDGDGMTATQLNMGDGEDEEVAKEDLVKAWRFGSTWVPMEKDTFEPLDTTKGVDILGLFPREAVSNQGRLNRNV